MRGAQRCRVKLEGGYIREGAGLVLQRLRGRAWRGRGRPPLTELFLLQVSVRAGPPGVARTHLFDWWKDEGWYGYNVGRRSGLSCHVNSFPRRRLAPRSRFSLLHHKPCTITQGLHPYAAHNGFNYISQHTYQAMAGVEQPNTTRRRRGHLKHEGEDENTHMPRRCTSITVHTTARRPCRKRRHLSYQSLYSLGDPNMFALHDNVGYGTQPKRNRDGPS
ncbi:hypothetical protein C8R47DRAFT_440299 [Mycena vitilis]|nr:hypothetical protein C8R47DRAFT_440299 [Mycena vitilis]